MRKTLPALQCMSVGVVCVVGDMRVELLGEGVVLPVKEEKEMMCEGGRGVELRTVRGEEEKVLGL